MEELYTALFTKMVTQLLEENCSKGHPYYGLTSEDRELVVESLADVLASNEGLTNHISDLVWECTEDHLVHAIQVIKEEC